MEAGFLNQEILTRDSSLKFNNFKQALLQLFPHLLEEQLLVDGEQDTEQVPEILLTFLATLPLPLQIILQVEEALLLVVEPLQELQEIRVGL